LPSFGETHLPYFLRGAWNNADQILKINGVKDNPFSESKKLVTSLTSGKYHDVTLKRNKLKYANFSCPGFNNLVIGCKNGVICPNMFRHHTD
jgi:hypothetical protein